MNYKMKPSLEVIYNVLNHIKFNDGCNIKNIIQTHHYEYSYIFTVVKYLQYKNVIIMNKIGRSNVINLSEIGKELIVNIEPLLKYDFLINNVGNYDFKKEIDEINNKNEEMN